MVIQVTTGLYSAIFATYLQHRVPDLKNGLQSASVPVVFFLLCILYVLSGVTLAGDMADFIFTVSTVTKDNHLFLLLSEVNMIVIQFPDPTLLHRRTPDSGTLLLHLAFLQVTITGLCDFISQSILVRHSFELCGLVLFIQIFKDLPLLDCMGSQYSYRHHSFNISNRISR